MKPGPGFFSDLLVSGVEGDRTLTDFFHISDCSAILVHHVCIRTIYTFIQSAQPYFCYNSILLFTFFLSFHLRIKENSGIILVRTATLLLVATYTPEMSPSICVEAVEKLGELQIIVIITLFSI